MARLGQAGRIKPEVEALEVGTATVERVRERFVEEGLEAALTRHRACSPRLHKLDGEQEARLIALVCSPPEEGQECWTLQLLADKLVELHIVESIARDNVCVRMQVLSQSPLPTYLKFQTALASTSRELPFVASQSRPRLLSCRPA